MSHKHQHLLGTVLEGPLSSNMHWREVESLLHFLGAKIEPTHGARFHMVLKGIDGFLHHPHGSNVCDKQTIKQLRVFLVQAGIKATDYEGKKGPAAGSQ